MKRVAVLILPALAVLALVPIGAAAVMFNFEGSAQGWGSFGPITTDSGQLVGGGSSGDGRYHVGDFDAAGWGMVDVSPVVDLSGMTTMSMDARFHDVPGFTPFSGTPTVEFAWYLAHSARRIDATHEQIEADYRSAEGGGVTEDEVEYGMVSGLVQYGWRIAHSARVHPDPAETEWGRRECEWWVPRVRAALERVGDPGR